jgi:hypothetical protein
VPHLEEIVADPSVVVVEILIRPLSRLEQVRIPLLLLPR